MNSVRSRGAIPRFASYVQRSTRSIRRSSAYGSMSGCFGESRRPAPVGQLIGSGTRWVTIALLSSCGSGDPATPAPPSSSTPQTATSPSVDPTVPSPTSANTGPGVAQPPSMSTSAPIGGAVPTGAPTATDAPVGTTNGPATSMPPSSSPVPPTTAPSGETSNTPNPVPPSGADPAADQTATELLATFDLGWNLGNSLDVPEGETNWNNPVVDAGLLQAVADAGFDLVRVPVTWSLFTGNAPSYTIDTARLARVEEVVGYARDAGLYAIINLHHDGADNSDGVEWLTLNDESGAVTDANNAAVEARFRAVWTQIATHFKTFDHGLLFESMNEIHDGYDPPDEAYYPIINHLNQVFVDIIRGSGGNNATRHLVVPGYNTNIDYTLAGFEAPQDPTADRLILSVHFYDPWTFAGEGSTPTWGAGAPGADSWGQEDFVLDQFQKLQTTYIDKGLPMIIGEYGAVNLTGSEAYRRYYMEYVTQAACQKGMVPVYWDNGGTGSGPDNFALIDRTSKEVIFPEILDAMFRACASTSSLDSIAKP